MVNSNQLIKEEIPSFEVEEPIIPDQQFNIVDYGAIGDGIFNNSNAFRNAIEACSNEGGGTVQVPEGIWLTGPIRLKSKVDLNVAFGAIIRFSDNYEDYPLIMSSFEGESLVRCQSPLDGEGLTDIAITGKGTFEGAGDKWRPVKKWKMTDKQWQALIDSGGVVDQDKEIWWPTENAKNGQKTLAQLKRQSSTKLEDYYPIREFLRPNMLSLRKCKRVLIDGPTFQNSPAWNLHPWLCEHVTIRHVNVRNPWYSQNGDGLDVESCRYVSVRDCTFDVGDDAICIKSGKDKAGRELGVPCQDILIEDCVVYHAHGGFVVGSEMSGGVKNISVNNCMFLGTDKGIRFKTTRGRGGIVENIAIENIRMIGISKEAIILQMYYEQDHIDLEKKPVTDETPVFRNLWMGNIRCIGANQAVVLKGLPEMPITGLIFDSMSITSNKGIECSYANDVDFKDTRLDVKELPLLEVNHCHRVNLN